MRSTTDPADVGEIRACHEQIPADFSVNDVTHTLHYLLGNMQRVDAQGAGSGDDETQSVLSA